nr:Origin recognition complex subunit 2 [Polyrhizophydium stewartii]
MARRAGDGDNAAVDGRGASTPARSGGKRRSHKVPRENDENASPQALVLPARTPEAVRAQKRLRSARALRSVAAESGSASDTLSDLGRRSASDGEDDPAAGRDDDGDCGSESSGGEGGQADGARGKALASSALESAAAFFIGGGRGKAATSNNTLSKLPRLEPHEFYEALSAAAPKHASAKAVLFKNHKSRFGQWRFELDAGFNLLFYGLGSKRALVQEFAQVALADDPLVIINGFFPAVSLKSILCAILSGVLGHTGPLGAPQTMLTRILDYFAGPGRTVERMTLVVHNIDGASLRNEKTQSALSRLADCPHIRLVATIDHINANLLWNSALMARFNWAFQDATTFADYLEEATFENSLMLHQSELGLQGVLYVLKSLPANARKLFRILAHHQIASAEADSGNAADSGHDDFENQNQAQESSEAGQDGKPLKRGAKRAGARAGNGAGARQAASASAHGMAYTLFLQKATESFLVNNELLFRTQLTEFRDHKIIHTKRAADGTDIFYIPLAVETLRQLQESEDV